MNDITLSPEFISLMKKLDHTYDKVKLYSDEYYSNILAISFELALLKAQSEHLLIPFENEGKYTLESLQKRYMDNAKSADNLETIIYSNINNYDFKLMSIRIKAQVDFLDLYFEIGKSSTRHDIKKYLTEKTGVTHYISEYRNGFIIRLHDMKSMNELQRRIQYLHHFDCNDDSFRIMEIELAVDFYRFKHRALVTALLKSIRLPRTAENFRVFKNQIGVFTPIPTAPLTLMQKLENGYNIGINRKDADEYWHLYVKTTDNNKHPLPKAEWRVRAEKNIKDNVLNKMDNRLINLKRVLLNGFKGLNFTQLRTKAPQELKESYKDSVKPFGIEREIYYNKSRHKRALAEYIEKNTALNQLVSNAVHNLLRNFTITMK